MSYWQGEKVRLRGIEPSDAEAIHRWDLDSDTVRLLDFLWPPLSGAFARAWAEEQSKKKLDEDRFHWIVQNREGEPVGTIATHACNHRNGTFSYGLVIDRAYRRRGYAAEAIALILRYYFEELRYQKVTVNVYANNEPSIRLHERLGFQQEGTLRRMHFTAGTFIDELWFGMTNDEFAAGSLKRALRTGV